MGTQTETADVAARNIGESSTPEELVAWSLEKFAERRLAITTAFGMEGCALIDMYARHRRRMRVIYLDTMFFFPETYALRDRLAARYPWLEFVNRGTTMTPAEQAALYGDELWKRDPNLCCKIRKVEPMRAALTGVDVWITGLQRSQSATRAGIRVLEWDWKYQILKLSPLAATDRKWVWEYIRENGVPYNELHERSYPTIGCIHCTKPVDGAKLGEYTREGRWAGFDKTECGLHGEGI
ncbi:MAG: phosphoadenylyl-sulfate reductase [Planctomycetota bacterium]